MKNTERTIQGLLEKLPPRYRETTRVWLFGLFKVPMLFWLRPQVVQIDNELCEVKIALNRRSRNHLKSMYFGALAAGADCAGGLMAMALIERSGKRVDLSFKDFHAEFFKRAEGDTHFTCRDGKKIAELVEKTLETKERENLAVEVLATCPSLNTEEVVAKFTLTLSLKARG